jgi:ankyrin repeat protein
MITRTTSLPHQEASHQQAEPPALRPAMPHIQPGAAGEGAMGDIWQARNQAQHYAIHADRDHDVEFSSSEEEFTDDDEAEDRESELTPLLAVQAGDLLLLQILLNAGTDVNQPLEFDATLLMHASEIGDLEVVAALLAAGADANKLDNHDTTALMLAVENGHADVVRTLLDAGSHIDQENWDGKTALMYAAIEGHADIVRALITAGADCERANPHHGSPLVSAALSGHTAVVEALVDAGANVNATDSFGITALMHAVQKGHGEIAECLLKADADISMCTCDGFTALGIAFHHKTFHMARMLLPRIAIARDQLQPVVSSLLNLQGKEIPAFVPPSVFDGHGGELISIVAEYLSDDTQGLHSLARLLTEEDQQTHWRSHVDRITSSARDGSKPGDLLFAATRNNDAQAVVALLATHLYGAHARQAPDNSSTHHENALVSTDLERAIAHGLQNHCDHEILAVLLDCRSTLENASASGRESYRMWLSGCLFDTVRHHRSGNSLFAVNALIAHGADVNTVHLCAPDAGATVLHLACLREQVSVVRRLLESSANPDATDIFMNTPAHFAANMVNSAPDVYRMLGQAGANLHARNALGLTPHHIMHHALGHSQNALTLLMDF